MGKRTDFELANFIFKYFSPGFDHRLILAAFRGWWFRR